MPSKKRPRCCRAGGHSTCRQRETIFPNARRHLETDGFYQRGMTSWGLPWMVELVVAIVGLVGAGIFLALAIGAYQVESAGPKDSQPEA
jgi:hypothetical protein